MNYRGDAVTTEMVIVASNRLLTCYTLCRVYL